VFVNVDIYKQRRQRCCHGGDSISFIISQRRTTCSLDKIPSPVHSFSPSHVCEQPSTRRPHVVKRVLAHNTISVPRLHLQHSLFRSFIYDQERRADRIIPIYNALIIFQISSRFADHGVIPRWWLRQTFVVGDQFDGLPHHDVVEKHCFIRRCASSVIIVGLGRGRGRIDTISKSTKVCALTHSGKLERAFDDSTQTASVVRAKFAIRGCVP